MADLDKKRSVSCPMSLDRKLSSDPLPSDRRASYYFIRNEDDNEITDEQLEQLIIKRAENGDRLAKFQLGQFYFEREIFDKALVTFERIKNTDQQAKYQLGVMFYDGLGAKSNPKKGVQYLKEVTESKSPDALHLIPHAQYNIGRAYYEGFGIRQSDSEAEKYFLLAAQDGDPKGSVKAQTVLGMFYARANEETFDLKKSYFWHQEATGNGSLESQGALGVMFEYGIGVKRNSRSAFKCLKEAAIRGNVYAQGNLAVHYYKRKLFNKAADVAKSVGEQDDIDTLARETDCLPSYVAKGIALGCFVYARCLHHGLGVDCNEKEALRWYSRVRKRGSHKTTKDSILAPYSPPPAPFGNSTLEVVKGIRVLMETYIEAALFDLDIVAKLQDEMTYGYI